MELQTDDEGDAEDAVGEGTVVGGLEVEDEVEVEVEVVKVLVVAKGMTSNVRSREETALSCERSLGLVS